MDTTNICEYCGKSGARLNVPSADRTKRVHLCEGDECRKTYEAERKQWLADWKAAHPKPVKKIVAGGYYNDMAVVGAFLGAGKKGGKK